MLEREMEDLIAQFPEEFFPGNGFVLKGRQQTFSGVGRFDLLFVDRYGTNILMELKAVPARYENATQLPKYKKALERQGETNILMWLVAPLISSTVREFLDRIGIEYTELHENQFRRIAALHGVQLQPEPEAASAAAAAASAGPSPSLSQQDAGCEDTKYEFQVNYDRQKLAGLVSRFEAAVKRDVDLSLARNLRRELIDVPSPRLTSETVRQLARWCKTDGIYADGMLVAQEISRVLFGVVLDRHKLGT